MEIKNTYFTAILCSGAKGTFRHFGVVSYVLVFTSPYVKLYSWSGSHKVLDMETLSSSMLRSEFMGLNRKPKVHERYMHFLCTQLCFRVKWMKQK